jgi:hypothetical protein
MFKQEFVSSECCQLGIGKKQSIYLLSFLVLFVLDLSYVYLLFLGGISLRGSPQKFVKRNLNEKYINSYFPGN